MSNEVSKDNHFNKNSSHDGSILEVNDLSVSFNSLAGDVNVVRDINFSV